MINKKSPIRKVYPAGKKPVRNLKVVEYSRVTINNRTVKEVISALKEAEKKLKYSKNATLVKVDAYNSYYALRVIRGETIAEFNSRVSKWEVRKKKYEKYKESVKARRIALRMKEAEKRKVARKAQIKADRAYKERIKLEQKKRNAELKKVLSKDPKYILFLELKAQYEPKSK